MLVEIGDGVVRVDGELLGPGAAFVPHQQPMVMVTIQHVLWEDARIVVRQLEEQIEAVVEADRRIAQAKGEAQPASPSADTEPPASATWSCPYCRGDDMMAEHGLDICASVQRIAGGDPEVP